MQQIIETSVAMATTADTTAAAVAALEASLRHKFSMLMIALTFGYGTMLTLCLSLLVYMRYHRKEVYRGDSSAARKIILPAFQPLLWLLAAVLVVYTVYFGTLISSESTRSDVVVELYTSGGIFVLIIIVVYMYQKSVTARSLQRATLISCVLSLYNVPVVWYTSAHCSTETAFLISVISRNLIVLFFVWVFIRPPARASVRALREYCVFVFVYFALHLAYNDLFYQLEYDSGFVVCYITILWAALSPIFIWRVMRADTEHWRGLGRRACALQSLFRQKHNLHEHISSRGLHVLIEMHRKYIIDFAYLELKQRIGVGASAVVFNGILHSKTAVAVKVYTPNELTEDTVAEFSHEAALCGALHHPNIVQFYGMCVCPPTICLVSELCQGSLDDLTRAIARREHAESRQQLLINLNYMIDATRAVVYLHSFSPAFLHRDIKTSNFLLDANSTVKLTDFGESRSLPRSRPKSAAQTMVEMLKTRSHSGSSETAWTNSIPVTPQPASGRPSNAMTVRGTADYMAPELIQGKSGTALYGEAADIYSLSITLWDILHPLEDKYPSANDNHLRIFECVISGQRPRLDDRLHPEIAQLLTDAWDPQPDRRPSAQYVLSTLEKIQQEVSSSVATRLTEVIEKSVQSSTKPESESKTITGQLLMQRMLELDFVDSVEEASRLGNGLMSTGFLHHVKHQEPFDKSLELFYFDDNMLHGYTTEQTIVLHQEDHGPSARLHMWKAFQRTAARSDASSTSSGSTTRQPESSVTQSHYYIDSVATGSCACRKLGSGVGQTRNQRKRFRKNKKWNAIVEESVLTEKLLTNEFDLTGESIMLDEFDHHLTSQRDLEAAMLQEADDEDEDDHPMAVHPIVVVHHTK